MIVLCVVAVTLGVVGFCGPARGAILYGNLREPNDGYTPLGASGDWLADSFSTGTYKFVLQDVKLVAGLTSNLPTGDFTVSLWTDATSPGAKFDQSNYYGSYGPGTLVATLGTVSDSALATMGVVNVPNPSGTLLAANTRYWIEVTAGTNGSSGYWAWSNEAGLNTASEYYVFPGAPASVTVYPNSAGPYQMLVAGTAETPEPTTIVIWSLLGGVGIAVGCWRRKRTDA
jgi:hypothetical protein